MSPRIESGVLHTRRGGEESANVHTARVEALPVVDEPAELAHRAVDHPQIRRERDESAQAHRTARHKESTEAERDELERETEPVKAGQILARVHRHGHVAIHIVVVVLVELPGLVVLAHERLDHAVAFDVLLHHRVHRGERIADRKEQRLGLRGELVGENEQERRHAGERERETPVDRRHERERAHEHDDAVEHLVAHPAEQMADRIGVGGHAAHDVAGARVIEIIEVERVQLLVFVAHQPVHGVLPGAFHPHLVAVVGAVAHDRHADQRQAQAGEQTELALLDHAVHNARGDERRDQCHRGADEVQDLRADHTGQLRPAIRHEPAQIAGVPVAVRVNVHRGRPCYASVRMHVWAAPICRRPLPVCIDAMPVAYMCANGIRVFLCLPALLLARSPRYATGCRFGVLCDGEAAWMRMESENPAEREKPAGLKPPANREKREKGSVIRDSEWNLVGFLSIADGYYHARRPLTHRVFSLRIRWVCSYRHTAGQV